MLVGVSRLNTTLVSLRSAALYGVLHKALADAIRQSVMEDGGEAIPKFLIKFKDFGIVVRLRSPSIEQSRAETRDFVVAQIAPPRKDNKLFHCGTPGAKALT